MPRWKKRVDGSPAQVGQPYLEEPRQQHSYARTKGSGAAQTPRSRSTDSMKGSATISASKFNQEREMYQTFIGFTGEKRAREFAATSKYAAPGAVPLKHPSGMYCVRRVVPIGQPVVNENPKRKAERLKIAATQDYVAGKITRATYRKKMRAAERLSGKTAHLNTEAYGKYVANSLHDGHGNKSNIVTINKPAHQIELKLTTVKTQELEPTQRSPDVEKRSQYFVDAIKRGQTIPPILVHRLPDGSYQIIDGHARVRAYQKMGIEKVPAVENGLTDVLASAGRKIGGAAKKAAVEGARAVGEMRGAYAAGEKSQQKKRKRQKKPKKKSRFFEQKDDDEDEDEEAY